MTRCYSIFKSAVFVSLLFLFSGHLNAQNISTSDDTASQKHYLEMIQDPDVNFYSAQSAFNNYWANRSDYKGNGWKVFKRWEYIHAPRVLPGGKLQPSGYIKSQYDAYMNQQDGPVSAGGNWTFVAPGSYPVNNTSQPTGMGRINAIAFHPTDAATIYVGSPSGGFWKTSAGGGTWTNLCANLPTLGVSSILVHPADPNIIYIGSGDRDADDAQPMGVFKTINGGVTWTQINNSMGNSTVGAMIMHPSDPNTILAATSSGIYKTTDGGSTWTLKSSGNFKDIRFKPGDPTVVYAVRILTPSEFYRSSNTGESWTKITSGIPTSGIGSRMVIGVSTADPSVVYLVQITSANRNFAGLLRSTDSGLTFTTRSTTPNIFDYECNGSGTASQATYDLCITVDPADASTLYVGSINNWKSTDGGVNWTIVSHWSQDCSIGISELHADQHVYEWSPLNGRLYVGHDGGISYTANNGGSWTEITGSLGISQVYRIGQSGSVSNLTLLGLQDNGSAASNGSIFTTTRGGDGTECSIDYNNTNYCYNTYVQGDISRSTSGPTGSYYNIGSTGTNGIGADETGAWVTPYFLHYTDPNVMFAGYENVWRTTAVKASPSSSVTWSAISSGETSTCQVLSQSPANVDIIYVVRSGSMKRTDNANASAGSVTWTACTLPDGATPTDVKAHPSDANIVFAAAGYKVYRSADKGASWTDVSVNLPALFINCLALDKNANEGLYVGNQTGVWYKDATMANWLLFSTGLPPVDVRELEIYYDAGTPANNRLKAATYGRGVWESDLPQVNVIDPTGFTATASSSSQIDLSWTKNASNQDVLVAWSPTSTFGVPADGTPYVSGNTLPSGGGTVIYSGSASLFNHTLLTSGTTYYHKIWSVNASSQYSAGLPPISAITYSHNWTGGAGTTDWFTPGNWGTSAVPLAFDNVYIPSGLTYYPLINAAGATCNNIKIETGASLSMSGATAYTLTVAGDWTNNGTFNRGIGTVDFNGTNLLQTIGGISTTNFYILSITKGSMENTLESISPITLNATSPEARLQLVSGTFKLSHSSSNIIAINSNGTAAANALGSGKRIWVNAGSLSVNSNWRINAGELKITGGVVNIGNADNQYLDYLNNGKINVQGGQLNVSAGIFGNAVNSTGIIDISGGEIIVSSFYNGYSRSSFEVSVQATFSWSGGTISIRRRGTESANSDYLNLSGTANVTGGTLKIGNTTTPASQIIRINSTVPIYNLEITSTNTPTAQLVTNGLTVKNDITISGGTLIANNLNLNVGGHWTNNGTFTPGTGTVAFNGTAAQNIAGNNSTTFKGFTMNNSAGATLSGSVNASVDGLLTLTSGVIATGTNSLIVTSNGSVSRASGHIAGNLQKNISTGTNVSRTFEIGDVSVANYTPVYITFASVGTAGNLTAKTISGDHPNISSAALNSNKSVNRYWSLTNSGVAFTTYNGVFDFLTNDLDGSANTSNLICGKYSGSSWTYPAVGTKTSNSTQITGLDTFSDFQLAEGSKISITTGGNWSNPSTWSPSGVPVTADNVTITSPGTVVADVENAVCNDLTIQNGAKLEISPEKALTVNGTLLNGAGNSGLKVKSDATGTGSLIHSTTDVDGTFERYMNNAEWTNGADGWHFLASPVEQQAISPAFTTDPYDFYAWYEPLNLWVNYKNTTTPPTWNTANSSTDFTVGKGYLADYDEAGIKPFTGKLNVEDVQVSGLTITGGGTNRSWHLLGNPFGSALNWDASADWELTNIAGVAKIWNEANQSYSDLSSTPASVIPATNGFMVQVNSGAGSLKLPASKRVHSTVPFYKSTSDEIQLKAISLEEGNAQESKVILMPGTSPSFDPMSDGEFLPGYAPMFYSTADDRKLSTCAIPEITSETEIPFGFVKTAGTQFRIEATGAGDLPTIVLLLDLKTGLTTNLGQKPIYDFSAENGDAPMRFLLKFGNTGMSGDFSSLSLDAWYSHGDLFLVNTGGNAQVEIFTLTGQEVYEQDTDTASLHLHLAPGIYFARISTAKQVKTIKFIIQE